MFFLIYISAHFFFMRYCDWDAMKLIHKNIIKAHSPSWRKPCLSAILLYVVKINKFSHYRNKVQGRPTLLENFNEWNKKLWIVVYSSPDATITSFRQYYMKGFSNFTDTFPSRRAHHEFSKIWNWCQLLLNCFMKALRKTLWAKWSGQIKSTIMKVVGPKFEA